MAEFLDKNGLSYFWGKIKSAMPSNLSELSDDSTHRLTTDTEKAKWNATSVFKELTTENLNDVKTVGFYVGKASNTCANKPSGVVQFGLQVVKLATDAIYYKQILTRPTASPGDEYVRTCVAGTWGEWSKRVDFSGSYNDLTNKPTIPTVNNASLIIQKNGTTVNTFTANASSNVTANIIVPTKTSDITNDSGFLTLTNGELQLTNTNARLKDITVAHVFSIDPASGGAVQLHYSAAGNHGIYSKGYSSSLTDSTTFNDDPTWIIYRNSTGYVLVPKWANMGSSTRAVFFNEYGSIQQCTYELNKTVPSDAVFTDTTYSVATTSADGLMSSTDKTKLNGIAAGAEVNQNAFSNIKVGSTTVAADSKTDTLELVAGTNITLTPDATNDKVTINASTSASGITTTGYLTTSPESNSTLLPFLSNDLAHLLSKGGSITIKADGTTGTYSNTNRLFDGTPSYFTVDNRNVTTFTFEVTLHTNFPYSSYIYIDFGSTNWGASSIKIEAKNSNFQNDNWAEKFSTTTNDKSYCYVRTSHTPTGGASSDGYNTLRITLSDFKTSSSSGLRIAQIGCIAYNSNGIAEVSLPKAGGAIYGNIYPRTNNTLSIGTSTNKFNAVYATTLNGLTVDNFSPYRQVVIGNCSTAAGTAAKAVTVLDWQRFSASNMTSVIYAVKFTNSNTASNVTLSINGGTAYPIYYNNAEYTGTSTDVCGAASRYTYYIFNGTHFVWLGMGRFISYSTLTQAEIESGTNKNGIVNGSTLKPAIETIVQNKISASILTATEVLTGTDQSGKFASAYEMKQAINNLNGHCYAGTCDTVSGTNTKVVTFYTYGFIGNPGSIVAIKFTNSNSASANCKIKFNDNVQGQVWYNGAAQGAGSCYGVAGHYNFYMWDGTYWIYMGSDT